MLTIFFGCKQKVSSKNQEQKETEKPGMEEKNTVSILFDSKLFSCNKGIKNGDDVEDGTELTASFIGKIEKGKKLKAVKIGNDEIEAGNKKKFKFAVDIKKAEKESDGRLVLKIEAKFENVSEDDPTPNPPQPNPPQPEPNPNPNPPQPDPDPQPDQGKTEVKIKFGDDIEKCEWLGIFSNTQVKNGGKVPFGTKLRFTAKLENGEKVTKWFINDKEQDNQKNATLEYTAKKEDADNKTVITVKCEKEQLQRLHLKYDHLIMECVNYDNGTPVLPNFSIYPDQKLKFTATIKPGFNLVNWTVNGDDKADERREVFVYTVKEEDAKGLNKEITIGYRHTENDSYKLIFDEKQIDAKIWKTGEKLKTGAKVHDDVWIEFKAILHGDDEVERWMVNGAEGFTSATYNYKIDKRNADNSSGEGVFHVTLKLQKKYKFEFDDALISVKYYRDNIAIDKEKGVTVGYSLVVRAKIKDGKLVKEWKINGKTLMNGNKVLKAEEFDYKVLAKDANDEDVIKIELTTEDASLAKIKFDETNIKCMQYDKEIKTDSEVKEGDILDFSMKKKIRSEKFQKWTVNDGEKGSKEQQFRYVVAKEDILNGEIRIAYNKIDLTPFTLQFADPIEKCTTNGEIIASGSACYEGEKLHFTLKNGIKHEDVESWTIKGVDQSSLIFGNYNYLNYTVNPNDVELIAGVFTLRVACKVREKIRIVFDDTLFKCHYPDGWVLPGASIAKNALIKPNEWIQFDAKLEAGKKVKAWKVNGNVISYQKNKHYWEGAGNKTLHCRFKLEDARVASDGVKEIEITAELE